MKAIILDDELHCVESLQILLEKYTAVKVEATFCDPLLAAKNFRKYAPDILFIDIEMPHLNGFEFLALFPDIPMNVVFTTAYDEFAISAFKVNAIDYLLKPISKDDLQAAVKKCEIKKDNAVADLIEKARPEFQSRMNKIAVPTMSGLEMIKVADIVYLESDSNYTDIIVADRRPLKVSRTLKHFEPIMLHHGFIRVHNSYIINPAWIQRYVKGDGGYLIMENGANVNVSRSKKEALLAAIQRIT